MLQIKSIMNIAFIITSIKIMQIPKLILFTQQQYETNVLQSGVSTQAASVQQFRSSSISQKMQLNTKTLRNQSVGCQYITGKLEQQIMIWFSLRGIKQGFPQQLLQDINLLQRREIISHLQRSPCNKSACHLGKRINNGLHISI